MYKFISMGKKTLKVLKEEGITKVARKTAQYINTHITGQRDNDGKIYKEILFINGCDDMALQHPTRYRIQHEMEQLKANNIDCDEVFYLNLNTDLVRNYRVFIIFRCPYTEQLERFIKLAKSLNKAVIYDIDDLLIDTNYTNQIKYFDTKCKQEEVGYKKSVHCMQKALIMCDAVISSTERSAEELKKYNSKLYINRNMASEEMLELSKKAYKKNRELEVDNSTKQIKLGYLSDNIKHNVDFTVIKPAIKKIMSNYQEVELHIVGLLDIPKELHVYKDRIIIHPFSDWEELPELIASFDINLVPMENNNFNEAKSENKWIEAALVKVPTVASNLGAFAKMIEQEKTGILCCSVEQWYKELEILIKNADKRKKIGKQAYEYCKTNCVTLYNGFGLARFVNSMYIPNLAMILPSLNISGGIMVALEHCKVLRQNGYDVTILNNDKDSRKWFKFQGMIFPVLPTTEYIFNGRLDKAVATMWSTMYFFEGYANIGKRYYLVQNFETDFYEPNNPLRIEANKKYSPIVDVQFLTISKWCENWLRNDYEKEARYLPNCIHTDNYCKIKRKFDGKIRILIEGDCGVFYKNVDESFRIVNKLDNDKYEIWYMSYNAEPKSWYRVDRFLHKIPFEEVPRVYEECHILLKTSLLESFSYPPLEMMATGGYVVAIQNDGNKEYMEHEKNCLFYPKGRIDLAIAAILRICTDEPLRERLYAGAIETAQARDWKDLEDDILEFYDSIKLGKEGKE